MADTVKYTCSCCGKEHEEWPALTFISPTGYHVLSEEDKQNIADIGSASSITLTKLTGSFVAPLRKK